MKLIFILFQIGCWTRQPNNVEHSNSSNRSRDFESAGLGCRWATGKTPMCPAEMRRLAQQNHTQEISHIPELANSGCEGGLFRKHHFYGHRGRKSSPGQHLKDLEFMNDLRWSWKMKDLMYYESYIYIILWCIDFAEWWKDNGPKRCGDVRRFCSARRCGGGFPVRSKNRWNLMR